MKNKKRKHSYLQKRNVESGGGKYFFIAGCEKNIHIIIHVKKRTAGHKKRQIHIRTCRFLCLKYGRSILSFPQIRSLLVNIIVQPIHKQ